MSVELSTLVEALAFPLPFLPAFPFFSEAPEFVSRALALTVFVIFRFPVTLEVPVVSSFFLFFAMVFVVRN